MWVRIAADYFASVEADDEAWIDPLRACLANASAAERSAYAGKLMESRSRAPGLWETLARYGGEGSPSAWKYAPDLPRRLRSRGLDAATARALATRADLDDAWIDAILATQDDEAAAALASNPRAPLRAERLAAMVALARVSLEAAGDRRVADALLAREPVRIELAPLFLEASPKIREALLLAAQRWELARRRPGVTTTLSRETIARLEQLALSGDSEAFTLLLARSIGASPALARRIVSDRQGEPLAVALAAIGAANDVCVRILTAIDMQFGAAYRRLNALARLSDILSPHAARRIIAALADPGVAQTGEGAKAPPLPPAHPRHAPDAQPKEEAALPRPQLPRKVSTSGAK